MLKWKIVDGAKALVLYNIYIYIYIFLFFCIKDISDSIEFIAAGTGHNKYIHSIKKRKEKQKSKKKKKLFISYTK